MTRGPKESEGPGTSGSPAGGRGSARWQARSFNVPVADNVAINLLGICSLRSRGSVYAGIMLSLSLITPALTIPSRPFRLTNIKPSHFLSD